MEVPILKREGEKGALICMHRYSTQSNIWRCDYLMLALSFSLVKKFCGEFTAECTHCSFPSSTIKEHLEEEHRQNIAGDSMACLAIYSRKEVFIPWKINEASNQCFISCYRLFLIKAFVLDDLSNERSDSVIAIITIKYVKIWKLSTLLSDCFFSDIIMQL